MLKVRLGCRQNEGEATRRIHDSVDHIVCISIEAAIDDTDIRPIARAIFELPLNESWTIRINIPFNADTMILLQCQHANRRRSLVQVPVPGDRLARYQRSGSAVEPELRDHIRIHKGVKHLRHGSANEQLNFGNSLVVVGHLLVGPLSHIRSCAECLCLSIIGNFAVLSTVRLVSPLGFEPRTLVPGVGYHGPDATRALDPAPGGENVPYDIFRLSAEEAFEQPDMGDDEFYSIVDRSLNPRSPDVLYDKLGVLLRGVNDPRILDAGCRDATHMCEIAERFDALVWGIDLVESNVGLARKNIADRGLSERVSVARGDIQSLGFEDDAFNVVWCRDMLPLVPDLRRAFSECARVLKSGGHMLIFTNFATELMEPSEAERICGPLGVRAENLSKDYFEAAMLDSGLRIVEREHIDGEWREWREEEGDRHTSRQMLRIARMLRNRDSLIDRVGRRDYEIELADCYWGVYHLIGKLSGAIYVLRRA